MMDAGGPVVRTGRGEVGGREREGVRFFLGIPYASAPYGELRFQPPEPAPVWEGVRPAVSYGPTPPKGRQSPHLERMFPERWIDGEDCLNLNIWTPVGAENLPVLVWIHGGGFTNGSGSAAEFDGTAFALSEVVCVTINYRVAADGFLFLDDGIANVGLLDQIAALEWVHDNIAAFGGDPQAVTLAGHSAGGSSVACLLSASRSFGLYARAVIQSTSGVHRLTSPDLALRVGLDLARRLGVGPTREQIAQVPVPALLRAVAEQTHDLETDPDRWGPQARTMAPWAPTVGTDLLATRPLELIRAGQGADVPLLTGTTREELRLYLTPDFLEPVTAETLPQLVHSYGLSEDTLQPYRDNRPAATPGDLLAAVATDWYFRRPVTEFAEARYQAGQDRTWVYRFDRPLPAENDGYGAAHGTEVPFVFDTLHVGETHARIGPRPSPEVSALMHGLWVRFARTGDPGWTPYDDKSRTTALLTETLIEAEDPDGPERTTWHLFA